MYFSQRGLTFENILSTIVFKDLILSLSVSLYGDCWSQSLDRPPFAKYSTFTSAPDEPGMSSAIFLRFMPLVKFIFLEWIFRMSNLACEARSNQWKLQWCKFYICICSIIHVHTKHGWHWLWVLILKILTTEKILTRSRVLIKLQETKQKKKFD